MEEMDMTIVDIPGALMQGDMDKAVHIKMEGCWRNCL